MADNDILNVKSGRDVNEVALLAGPLHFRLVAISTKVPERSVWLNFWVLLFVTSQIQCN